MHNMDLDESWEIIDDLKSASNKDFITPSAKPKAVSFGPAISHRPKSIHQFDVASLSSGLPAPRFDASSAASSLLREVPGKPLPFTMKRQSTPESLQPS